MRNLYDGYYEQDTPGQNKMKRVFDSTAIHSTARFANRIQSALFEKEKIILINRTSDKIVKVIEYIDEKKNLL